MSNARRNRANGTRKGTTIWKKLREVVTMLQAHTPLNNLTEQEGYEVLAWAEANLERGQSGDMVPRPELNRKAV
ncbi:hypothetical protein [Bradyrhizobium sp. McL0615]|uniref:hypothetical protein n=1 Tax=Bradyrhizobium sp. McL0615 TaxID=3415673 RepID=UPI003CF3FA0F